MMPPNLNPMPRSELETFKLASMHRRRREIIDASLRGGHPYHLAKKWALLEVPDAAIKAALNERERLRDEERGASAKADSRPWWMAFVPGAP